MRTRYSILLFIFVISAVIAVRAAQSDEPGWRVDGVLAAMHDPCVGTRNAAVEWLRGKSAPDPRIALQLDSLLQDTEWEADRGTLLAVLSATGTNQLLCANTVFKLLGDGSALTKCQAIDALAKMPLNRGQILKLSEMLNDSDFVVRQHAIGALTNLAAGEFAREFAKIAATDSIVQIRFDAMDALITTGTNGPFYTPEILNLFTNSDAAVRGRALETIGKLETNNNRYATAVVPLLGDDDPHVRYKAVQTIGAMGPPAANVSERLKMVIDDGEENWDTRLLAVDVYCRGPLAGAFVNENARYLEASNALDRANTLLLMARFGRAGAGYEGKVVQLLNDPDRFVRRNAIDVLYTFNDYNGGCAAAIAKMLKDPDKEVRSEAFSVLRNLKGGGQPAKETLLQLMENQNYPDRQRILELLGMGDGPEKGQLASECLADSDPRVRNQAVRVLVGMGEGGVPYAAQIWKLCDDQDLDVRSSAIDAVDQLVLRGAPCPTNIDGLLQNSNVGFRILAIHALAQTRNRANASKVATFVSDPDNTIRFRALDSLVEMGAVGAEFSPKIAALISDPRTSDLASSLGSASLERMRVQFGNVVLITLFEAAHVGRKSDEGHNRLIGYITCGVTATNEVLRRWLGFRSDDERPKQVTPEEIRNDIAIVQSVWPLLGKTPDTRKEAAEVLAFFARRGTWGVKDIEFLNALKTDLWNGGFFSQASEIEAVIAKIRVYSWLKRIGSGIAIQCVFWVILLFVYPHTKIVQALFFWNKTVRRICGLGYIGPLIPYIEWSRKRLFLPFRTSLLPRALLAEANSPSYFDEQEVVEEMRGHRSGTPQLVTRFIAEVTGPTVVEGESGLGKTLLLQKRAQQSRTIAAFLRATDCSQGVLKAIQHRLQGQVRDEVYLKTLIHAGALDLLIDGLNEASPDTRSKISHFVEENFSGTFILTTQRLSGWTPPSTARIFTLRSLRPNQVQAFLLKQWDAVKDIASSSGVTYEHYVQNVDTLMGKLGRLEGGSFGLGEDSSILRNPMEARLAAELLAQGEIPDGFRLVQQRCQSMESDFQTANGKRFPSRAFAERVYEWRASDSADINMQDFWVEANELERHRLMIRRMDSFLTTTGEQQQTRWFFRHDRIMEYFLLPAFLRDDKKDRRFNHISDERFWGVYDLLAVHLKEADEDELYKFLNREAADTNENNLRNRYEKARRLRAMLSTDSSR